MSEYSGWQYAFTARTKGHSDNLDSALRHSRVTLDYQSSLMSCCGKYGPKHLALQSSADNFQMHQESLNIYISLEVMSNCTCKLWYIILLWEPFLIAGTIQRKRLPLHPETRLQRQHKENKSKTQKWKESAPRTHFKILAQWWRARCTPLPDDIPMEFMFDYIKWCVDDAQPDSIEKMVETQWHQR